MNLLRKKLSGDKGLDQAIREVLLAVNVSEEEIEVAAGTPDLYGRLQNRIAEERVRRDQPGASDWRAKHAGLNFSQVRGPQRSPRWAMAAALVLIIVAVALLLWLPKQPPESNQIAQPLVPQAAPSPVPLPRQKENSAVEPDAPRKSSLLASSSPNQVRRIRRQRFSENRAAEVATEFLPLTFAAESAAPESGHLVRVTIPRSALVAMGLPMNVERAGELVRAEVFIGDDGLARAIRFIQ